MNTHFVKARKRGQSGAWLFLDRSGRGVRSRKSARQVTEETAAAIVADGNARSPDYEFKAVPISKGCREMALWGSHPKYCGGAPVKIAGGSNRELGKQAAERQRQGFTGLCIVAEGEPYPTEFAKAD